jgi:diguanylate cyclase (GGDEF)-like protein
MSELNILEQYKNLQRSGTLDELEALKKTNKDLERIISDISKLIQFTDIDKMFDFMISKFLDYFIPEYLTFLIKPPRTSSLRGYCFHQLKFIDEKLPHKYYDALKSFFEIEQTNIKPFYFFDEVKEKIGDKKFDNDFLSKKPYLIIPLTGIGGVYGIAILSKKIIGGDYTKEELQYVERMFSVLAVTIQNGLHYETSIRDPKTGFFTYDYFLTRLKENILYASRYKHFSGLIMLDIDHFKKFNDTYGHLAGDRVLETLAETLVETVRGSDCVARFGGEEFSILIQECNPETLFITAERIRKAVEKIELYEGDEKLSITISCGACMITDMIGLSPKYLIKKADQALYYSKQNGRNQSNVFSMGLLDKICMLKEANKLP